MSLLSLAWLVGPLILLGLVVAVALRRGAYHRDRFDAARDRSRTSDASLAAAMSDALTRARGQELAVRARHDAFEAFVYQVVDHLPHGLFVVGCDGNLRMANAQALQWLGVDAPAQGQVLWTRDGTDAMRAVAEACRDAAERREAMLVGPGAPGTAVLVTTLPLRSADGVVDGVLCLIQPAHVA